MPLVYVSLPDKAANFPLAASSRFTFEGQLSKRVGQLLAGQVDRLDVDAAIARDPDSPTFAQLHFKTDFHYSTYGEFWLADVLAAYLEENYGVSFPDGERVFDLENYDVASYEFLGNTALSVGTLYAGMDRFDVYTPLFDTSITVDVPTTSEWRTGRFEDVLIGDYTDDPNAGTYTYCVTDFGRWPQPYYQFINNKSFGPAILLITDSVFMRGASYLALACGKVTVVDPRYFDGTDYLAYALSQSAYDAVAIIGESSTFFSGSFSPETELPQLPVREMIGEAAYGAWTANGGLWLDFCNEQLLHKPAIPAQAEGQSLHLSGWAVDFCAGKPFFEVYCQVGDSVFRCDYGSPRQSVVDAYGKQEFLNTGLEVTIPAQCLEDGVDRIVFVCVSADGQAMYQPVEYPILYETPPGASN